LGYWGHEKKQTIEQTSDEQANDEVISSFVIRLFVDSVLSISGTKKAKQLP